MRTHPRPALLVALALAACANPTPEERACHQGYPDGGADEIIDGQEGWLVCFPDGGNVACESAYGANPPDQVYPAAIPGACLPDGTNPCSGQVGSFPFHAGTRVEHCPR